MIDVLLIDDEVVFLKSLAEGLRMGPGNFSVLMAATAEKAIDILRTVSVDVVVTDLKMPGMNGYELIRRLQTTRPFIPIVIMSAYTRDSVAAQLQGLEFAAYIEKPASLPHIADVILHVGPRWSARENGKRRAAG